MTGLLADVWTADGRSKNLSPFILLHCIAFRFISFNFRNISTARPTSQQQQFAHAILCGV